MWKVLENNNLENSLRQDVREEAFWKYQGRKKDVGKFQKLLKGMDVQEWFFKNPSALSDCFTAD